MPLPGGIGDKERVYNPGNRKLEPRCQGRTKKETQCRKAARAFHLMCDQHADQEES